MERAALMHRGLDDDRRRVVFPLLLFVWGLIGGVSLHGPLAAERLFRGGLSFPLSDLASRVHADDLDLDGRIDVVVGMRSRALIRVFLNDPETLLVESGTYDVGRSPIEIISGDLDGDRWPDLFVINSGSGTVSVLLNRGDGTFHAAQEVSLNAGFSPVAGQLAHLDGDDILDAAVNDLGANEVNILIGEGGGRFRVAASLEVGDNAHSLSADDYDGDGVGDLVVIHSQNGFLGTVSFFRGNGDEARGYFDAGVETILGADRIPRFLASGDFDEDGRPDFSALTDQNVLLYLTNPVGGIFDVHEVSPATAVGVERDLRFLRAVDFDLDGHLDLVTPLRLSGNWGIHVHQGNGDGTFDFSGDIFLEGPMKDMNFADLDQDAIPDAIVAGADPDLPELVVIPALAPGDYETREVLSPGPSPRGLAGLDVDRDGRTDLVTLATSSLHVFLADAAGGFGAPVRHDFVGSAFRDMVAADFDGDGARDLALGDLASGNVTIGFLAADGAFARTFEYPVTPLPFKLASADFDGDDFPDLAVSDQSLATLTVLRSPGVPDVSPRSISLEAAPSITALVAGDLNGDRLPDLAAASRDDGISIFFGDGNGGFAAAPPLAGAPAARDLEVVDLDGDGANELVAALREEIIIYRDVGGLRPDPEPFDPGFQINAIGLLDLDRDGEVDLAHLGNNKVFFFRGLAGGGFDGPERYYVGDTPKYVEFSDFNGDGLVDCAAADTRSVSVLTRTASTAFFRRGDADQDGQVLLNDAVAILNRLFRSGPLLRCHDAADTNDDGLLNLSDAVSLLQYLFRGGEPPPAPGAGECGRDETADMLTACSGACR